MTRCLACGAENPTGRGACRVCWAALPAAAGNDGGLPIAQPAARAARGGEAWLFAVALAVMLTLLAGVLVWYFGFRPQPAPRGPDTTLQAYLTALVLGDVPGRRALATVESLGSTPPPWLHIVDSRLLAAATVQGGRATVPVELGLASRRLRVTASLRLAADGWRVDQRAFFAAAAQAAGRGGR
jgi:hypothetical protein